jgi:2-polyprenyl-6-methoxyphenol hydroxylase-like FAD-dependent oxidoreductase
VRSPCSIVAKCLRSFALEQSYSNSSGYQTEGGTGHVGFICHKQPVLERHLRYAAGNYACGQIRTQSTLISLEEDADWVYATYENAEGERRCIRSKFLVGADGKTGFTRKKYLEPKGVSMELSPR